MLFHLLNFPVPQKAVVISSKFMSMIKSNCGIGQEQLHFAFCSFSFQDISENFCRFLVVFPASMLSGVMDCKTKIFR
jgi:hypothetical protein